MADRDVRVDQSPDDLESASGGGPAGSGDTGGGQGTEASDKAAPPRAPSDGFGDGGSSGEEPPPSGGADVDPLGDPKDGPPTVADDGGVEGQVGAGGGGGSSSGGLFDDIGGAVSDAYDDVEDAANDATEDVGDASAGAYTKVEDGAASLGHDIEEEVAEEWRDAGTFRGWDEHHGGIIHDPVGTWSTPFTAADRAYDAVEDDIAKAADDTEDAVEDAYEGSDLEDAYETVEDATGPVLAPVADAAVDAGIATVFGGGLATGSNVFAYRLAEEGYKAATGQDASADLNFGAGAEPVAVRTGTDGGSPEANDVDGTPGLHDGAIDGGFGTGDGGGGTVDDLGGDAESESPDPLAPINDVQWDAAKQVAEQASEEDAQDAASHIDEVLDAPGPVSVPGGGTADDLELD